MGPRSLALWFWRRRFLKGFYHIWAWRPSWSCDPDAPNKLSFPRPMETPHEIWLRLAQLFWRRRSLKMVDGQRTDDGACLYYKLTSEPKDAGELKKPQLSDRRTYLPTYPSSLTDQHTCLPAPAVWFKQYLLSSK